MDCGPHTPMEEDDRRDRELRALFRRDQVHVTEQTFVNDVARRISASRRQRTFMTRAAQAIAIGALIAASPWLVSGSALLSTKLDGLFSSAASALDSPLGYGAELLCFVAVTLVLRRRLFG
jgi:hypothetical protein